MRIFFLIVFVVIVNNVSGQDTSSSYELSYVSKSENVLIRLYIKDSLIYKENFQKKYYESPRLKKRKRMNTVFSCQIENINSHFDHVYVRFNNKKKRKVNINKNLIKQEFRRYRNGLKTQISKADKFWD